MISIVTGKLGAGKTLSSVVEMLRHWIAGGTVCTNVIIHWEPVKRYCAKRHGVKLLDKQLQTLDLNGEEKNWHTQIPFGVPGGLPIMVVLDEVQLFFNARDWATTRESHGSMISFLTQSRKAAVDVRFITQAGATVDKQFRLQCQFEFFIVPSANLVFGFLGSLPFKFYLLVKKDANNGNKLTVEYRFYDSQIFDLYDSFDMLDNEMRDLARKTERRAAYKLERVALWVRGKMIFVDWAAPIAKVFGRRKIESS